MAKKGTHGYFEDENKETSFDDFKTDMTNIDDEVDKILPNKEKQNNRLTSLVMNLLIITKMNMYLTTVLQEN